MILIFFNNLLLTCSIWPFKSQVFAAAGVLVNFNAHWGGGVILDEKDLHLMGQHFPIHLLKLVLILFLASYFI